MFVSACVALLLLLHDSEALVDSSLPGIFYPFGVVVGDRVLPNADDFYTPPLPITVLFPFFNSRRSNITVC